ncbi:rapamycin-insensitive companion of mTOR, partial [Tremellales sp. Uapishka_1]
MSRLAIERRVQYGAEKMLDVIEKRTGGGESGEQEQVKERITAQLEAANEHIKMLEARLERLKSATPQRPRKRPQPRLNGYASTSNLGAPLSSSQSSSLLLSSSARPYLPRQRSNLTPERDVQRDPLRDAKPATPIRDELGGTRPRSKSAGEDSMDMGQGEAATSRLGWTPGLGSPNFARTGSGFSNMRQDNTQQENEPQENSTVMLETIKVLQRQLRQLERDERDGGKGKSPQRGDAVWDCMTRMTEMVKRSNEVLSSVDVQNVLLCIMPFMGDSSTTQRRSAGYRLLRHLLDRATWIRMLDSGIEWLIVRTFTRDARSVIEREQALRLLRAVITLPPLPVPLPRHEEPPEASRSRFQALGRLRIPLTDGLVRALVSIAENPDDAMRTICMETLVEIGIIDLPCLLRSDAFRTVLAALKDGPSELGPSITALLLYLVNQPTTRQLLIPGSDLETVLVGLTEEYGKVPSRMASRHMEKLQECVRNVSMLLGSWTGLIYLCMDEMRAIKSLIGSLHVPITEMRDAILDLLFAAFKIKMPTWLNAFLDGRRLTVYNRTQEASLHLQEDADEEEQAESLNLVDNFVSLLLAVFLESGLLEALVSLIEENETALNRKATLLLGEILQLANRTLPMQYAAHLQSLPKLFSSAAAFLNPEDRHSALSALSSIDSLNRNQSAARTATVKDRSNSIQDSLQRGQRQVQQVKLRLGLQIEDRQFQQLLNDSGVLLGRDHTKWSYDIILEVVEGPLLNPRRLDEAIKATKFVKRLFSFFHPFNNRFSSIKRTRPNHKWVRLGCAVLSTLLANAEGIKYITEDKLLRQIVDCISELDQYSGSVSSQPVFARDRLDNSLSYGYFEMIGTLCKHREGIKLLERFKFFTCFYHLSELRSRDDIVRIIIECFDYSIDAHPRVVLSKALTASYIETRLFATHHLGRLIQESPNLIDWALELMITQLYDTSMDVCDVAVMYLEDACTDPENLEKVVQLRPTLEHLGDVGHPLFMRFVSTSIGFQYLNQAQYVDRELDVWLLERNLLYVIEVETFVSKTVRPFTGDTVEDHWSFEGAAPMHFFGELTKTKEGCQLLKDKGLVAEFAEIVRLHGMESNDQAVMTNVKSVLWALGNIGSTEGGLPFLEDEEIIEVIIEIAEQSPVLTMKGTCFFVIGLLSSTSMGAEVLEEFGWIATRTPMGLTTGLCLPNDIGNFVKIEPWDRTEILASTAPLPALTGLEKEIITAISNLSNYVLAAGAMNNLKRIRNRHPRHFASITLFHRATRMISSNHYQAPVRRFILDLFDVQLSSETLLQLNHLEDTASAPPLVDRAVEDMDAREHRRRSASSPGPQPLERTRRARGLTVSALPDMSLEPRHRVRGFGVPDQGV